MLRITIKRDKKRTRILYLEGKICQEWVRELQSEMEKGISDGERIILDFSKVSYLDAEAAGMINEFPPNKVESRNGSLFIQAMLNEKVRGAN
jgi:anti-anti-sigma regulatory factor